MKRVRNLLTPPSLRRDQSGAMYAEAIMTLPVFVLLWALILFVNDGFKSALASATDTRRDGWIHAMGGCQDDAAAPTVTTGAGGYSLASLPAVGTIILGTVTSGFVIPRRQPAIPVVYLSTFGFNIDTNQYARSGEITRPGAIGGTARFGHRMAITCNEDLTQVNDVAMGGYITAAYLASWSDLH